MSSNAPFLSSLNDSGFRPKCELFQKSEKCLEETKKELVSNILESKNEIDNLKDEVKAKDTKIGHLEFKQKNEEIAKDKLKKERDTKVYQLKEKKKHSTK